MSISSDLHTIRDYIRYAVTQFNSAQLYYGHGTDNAWDEAITLIFHSLRIPQQGYDTTLDARLTHDEKNNLITLIQQRVDKHIPVPYLTHEAWFAGLSFYVDERVLIPRSPMAELIEQHFSPWIEDEHVHTILDLCTGSGCIAIACASAFEDAEVDASDISKDALAVAKINVLRHGLEDRINLIESDLFQSIPEKKYDIIISNPPYVNAEDMFNLPNEYKHEPAHALEAGNDGLDLVKSILKHASRYLSEHGILIVEVGNSEVALADSFPDVPFTWLEFERGGDGVFLLTAEQVKHYHSQF